MKELAGRVAVVTGAASGIGLAMAQRFAAEKMQVVLADVEEGQLQKCVNRLRKDGADVVGMQVDVREPENVHALARYADQEFGAVHVLCNNAGVDTGGPIEKVEVAAWKWVMDVNFYGVVNGCRAFMPMMRAAGEGHIINTASLAAVNSGMRTMGPYIASKAAVLGFSENLAVELADSDPDIGVSVMLPGGVKTRMTESERNRPEGLATFEDPLRAQIVDGIRSATERDGLQPAEIAGQVVTAIHNRSFYILTHRRQALEAVSQRLEWMKDDRQPSPRNLR